VFPARHGAIFRRSPAKRGWHPRALPTVDISLAWHERVHHDPANAWMRDQIVKTLRPQSTSSSSSSSS